MGQNDPFSRVSRFLECYVPFWLAFEDLNAISKNDVKDDLFSIVKSDQRILPGRIDFGVGRKYEFFYLTKSI